MEPWLKITLIVLISLLGFYIFLLLFDLIFILTFKAILRKHEKGFSVVLSTKLDSLKNLFNLISFHEYNVEELIAKLDDINVFVFEDQDNEECKAAKSVLTSLTTEAFLMISKEKALSEDEGIILAKNNVVEQDKIYSKYIAMYNADVLGYNYWIRFLPWRFLFKLLKVKTKELI